MALYVAPFGPRDRRGIAVFYPGQILGASDYFSELESDLDRVKEKKTLIFWGLNDPGFPAADLRRMEHAFANHRTMEFSDAGHFFFEDKYREMIPEIIHQQSNLFAP
jgi:haloalkane dehalogenase